MISASTCLADCYCHQDWDWELWLGATVHDKIISTCWDSYTYNQTVSSLLFACNSLYVFVSEERYSTVQESGLSRDTTTFVAKLQLRRDSVLVWCVWDQTSWPVSSKVVLIISIRYQILCLRFCFAMIILLLFACYIFRSKETNRPWSHFLYYDDLLMIA